MSPQIRPEDRDRISELGGAARQWAAAHYEYCSGINSWKPSGNSQWEHDRTHPCSEADGSGVWGPEVHGEYVSMIANYLSVAAENLDGLGASLLADAALFPPFALGRAAYEHYTRVLWLQQPISWLQRAARSNLEYLFGLEQLVKGLPRTLPDGRPNEYRARYKEARRSFRNETLPKLFPSVEPIVPEKGNDATNTKAAGERLLSPTEASSFFEQHVLGQDLEGQVYGAMCLTVHPNVHAARQLSGEAPDSAGVAGYRFQVFVPMLERMLQLVAQAFANAELCWASYNRWDESYLQSLMDDMAEVLPGIFVPVEEEERLPHRDGSRREGPLPPKTDHGS